MNVEPPGSDRESDDELVRRAVGHRETESAAPQPTETQTSQDKVAAAGIPKRIGQYHIKRSIASGGMGTVYEAVQEKPRRTVAVKLMRAGIASRSALRRFEYESQLLARLRHPGIAQVYDAGTHRDGEVTVPYFAMEYILGAQPITKYAASKKLGTRQRLELFAEVCDAVHHGHQKGIIHRDLKPSNILVDSSGQVKIIDFGVARCTDSDMAVTTLQTDVGQLIGTLQYMSPEQCAADPHDIDTRSDVYALGVVLYELLAGRLPYDISSAAIHEATRVIREQEPAKLSTLNRTLRGDVETIALKALEKDRERRYRSTAELADDLRRYLHNEPITARPPSMVYQLQVFARRHKGLFGAVAAVFVVLLAGVIVSTSQYLKADAALKEAELARDDLEIVVDFQSSMLSEIDAEQMGRGIFADLREGIRDALKAKEAAPDEIDATLASFDKTLTGVNATDLALKVVDEHLLSRAVETIERDFADQPLVRAGLQQTVAVTYREIGLYALAMPLQEATLRTRRRELGDDHADTLESINEMGELLYCMRKYTEAEPYYREALEGRRRILGDDHPLTLSSIANVGGTLRSTRRYEESESYQREALEGFRRVLGDDHADTLQSINGVGVLLAEMGKHAEAEAYYREALEGYRRVLGDDHPRTVVSTVHMGHLLNQLSRYDDAADLLQAGEAPARRIYTGGNARWLGNYLAKLGEA